MKILLIFGIGCVLFFVSCAVCTAILFYQERQERRAKRRHRTRIEQGGVIHYRGERYTPLPPGKPTKR